MSCIGLSASLRSTVFILVAFSFTVANAQWSQFEREQLAAEIDAAAANIDPNLFPKLAQSKADTETKLAEATNFLRRKTDQQNYEAWIEYLDPVALAEALAEDESDIEIARHAMDLRYRLVGTAPGLELTVLRRLRDSLEQLVEAVRFRDPERATTLVAKQLESLADRVREMDDRPSPDDAASINAFLGVLDSSGQAVGLVQRLRNTFSRPNFVVLVAEPMVQSAITRSVNECRPINDCILGTRIIGTACINGVVTANLLPAIGAAHVEVTLAAHVTSNNTGYNGPVRLRTTGQGDVNSSRRLQINESGVVAEPTYTTAALHTQINAIEHRMRLVRRIAKKRAAEQKPQADQIAVEKMRRQVGAQFDEQTSQATAVSPPDMFSEIRPVLKRLSLEEPSRLWGSTDDALFIDATFRRDDQTTTIVSRPLINQPYDAAVQIHESVVDNAMAPVLAGRTMTEEDMNELMSQSGMPASTKGKEGDAEEPPFEVDFAGVRPIIFEARVQTVRLGIRGTRFSQGKRELKRAMEISARYVPATTADGKAILVRQGEVEIDFPGPNKRLTVSQAGLKRTIQKKFADVFPETLLHRPLQVPPTVQLESVRGRSFYASLIDAQDGWLSVAIR